MRTDRSEYPFQVIADENILPIIPGFDDGEERRRSRRGNHALTHPQQIKEVCRHIMSHPYENELGGTLYIYSPLLYLHAVCKLVLLSWVCNLFGLTLTGYVVLLPSQS